jgi:biopolymer transport protein ExbD/biopolymer transport protein TolR
MSRKVAIMDDERTNPDAIAPVSLAEPDDEALPSSEERRHRRRRHAHGAHGHGTAAATEKTRSDINVTPLVDVVLVLLIIFMVVTPMLHRGVKLELPETVNHEKKQDTGEQLIVSVRKEGVYVETQKLEGDALIAKLKDELKHMSRPVNVRADRGLHFSDVRKVLDELHDIGAVNVGLATEDKKE